MYVKGDLKGKRRRWPIKKERAAGANEKRREQERWGRRRKEHGEPVAASARQLEAQLQPGAVTSTRGASRKSESIRER